MKEFRKIELKPSETKKVEFSIPIEELGLWNKNMEYSIESGEFDIMIGSSSEDIRLTKTIMIN